MSHTAQLSINNSNSQQLVEISPQFTSNVILPQKCKKPSDCLVFGCNILITKWLAVWRLLSGNCLDGLLMKVIVRWKDLSDVRNSVDRNCRSRLNPENRNMGITTLTFGHLSDSKSAQLGQARYPCWASIVPQLGKHRAQFQPKSVIRPFYVFFIYCLQSFVFYKASFVCF